MDLRECLKEVVRDRDYYRELANTLMEDIDKISDAHENELTTLRIELDKRGPAPLSIEAECVQLRSQVTGLEE